ncbi:hypothetical protein RJ641_007552, partial [Dillenia turbinata]
MNKNHYPTSQTTQNSRHFLTFRQINALAVMIVFAASSTVRIEDFSFVVFSIFYMYFFTKVVFSSLSPSHDQPVFAPNNKTFGLHVFFARLDNEQITLLTNPDVKFLPGSDGSKLQADLFKLAATSHGLETLVPRFELGPSSQKYIKAPQPPDQAVHGSNSSSKSPSSNSILDIDSIAAKSCNSAVLLGADPTFIDSLLYSLDEIQHLNTSIEAAKQETREHTFIDSLLYSLDEIQHLNTSIEAAKQETREQPIQKAYTRIICQVSYGLQFLLLVKTPYVNNDRGNTKQEKKNQNLPTMETSVRSSGKLNVSRISSGVFPSIIRARARL